MAKEQLVTKTPTARSSFFGLLDLVMSKLESEVIPCLLNVVLRTLLYRIAGIIVVHIQSHDGIEDTSLFEHGCFCGGRDLLAAAAKTDGQFQLRMHHHHEAQDDHRQLHNQVPKAKEDSASSDMEAAATTIFISVLLPPQPQHGGNLKALVDALPIVARSVFQFSISPLKLRL